MTDRLLTTDLSHARIALEAPVPPAIEPIDAEAAPLLALADLRFFVVCYLAGLIFFLVMLS